MMKVKSLPSFDEHIPWVKGLAYKLSAKALDPSIDSSDLIQEGLLAVHESIENGKGSVGYLKVRAWGAMMTAIVRTDFVSSTMRGRIKKAQEFSREFAQEFHREPTAKELEEVFGEGIEWCMVQASQAVALTHSDGETVERATANAFENIDTGALYKALGTLSSLQREIIELRFMKSKPWNEIQDIVCISKRGTIFYHYKRALDLLREELCGHY